MHRKIAGHYPFITYQRDIAQQNRQLQALQHNARRYANDVARGNIAPNRKIIFSQFTIHIKKSILF